MRSLLASLLLCAALAAQTQTGGKPCGVTLRYSGYASACTLNAKLTIHQLGLPAHGGKPALLLFGIPWPRPATFPVTGCWWYIQPLHIVVCPALPKSGSVSWNSGAYPCSWVGLWVYHQFVVLTPRGLVTSNWGRAKVVRG